MKVKIISFCIILLSVNQSNACYRYHDGLVDEKYSVVFGKIIFDIGAGSLSKYLYSSQVKSGVWINLKDEKLYDSKSELYEFIDGEKNGAKLDIEYSSDLYTQAKWVSSDGVKKLSFKAWVDPLKYLKVNEEQVSGNKISIFRKQVGIKTYVLALSVNDSEIFPILKSDCSTYFGNEVKVEFYGDHNEIMFVSTQSWPAGAGSLFTEVTVLFDLNNNNLISWLSIDSGSGGASHYSNGNRSVVFDNDFMLLIEKSRSSGRDDKRYNSVNTKKFAIAGGLKLISSVKKLETYIHQELISEETTVIPLKSAEYNLINRRSEYYPPNI